MISHAALFKIDNRIRLQKLSSPNRTDHAVILSGGSTGRQKLCEEITLLPQANPTGS